MEKILELLMSNPELVAPTVKAYIEKYKPMVYAVLQEAVEIYRDYSENTDHPAVVARIKRNMYEAYLSVGFTEDQAMTLMVNDNAQLSKFVSQLSAPTNKTIGLKP